MIGEIDPFYPFPVIYAEVKVDTGLKNEAIRPEKQWLAYDDNWTDGAIHQVFLISGIFYSKSGGAYDESYSLSPLILCSPNIRQAFAAVPYIAEYLEVNGSLFCPNGHKACYNYPFPGCLNVNCPFYRCRQHHYSESYMYPWARGKILMTITINGQKFQENYLRLEEEFGL